MYDGMLSVYLSFKGDIKGLSIKAMTSQPGSRLEIFQHNSTNHFLQFQFHTYPAGVGTLDKGLIVLKVDMAPLRMMLVVPVIMKLVEYMSVLPLFQESFTKTFGHSTTPAAPPARIRMFPPCAN
jgi:hypothetical protein